jgi:hypothetical protein
MLGEELVMKLLKFWKTQTMEQNILDTNAGKQWF